MAWISTAPTMVKEDRIAGTKLCYVLKIKLGTAPTTAETEICSFELEGI